ncbi:MAG TPA: maleylpyruvate isomerase family mycothiol-dependent enzyme, partial [Pseudonocardiaceae bacterium]|nr:maleylpyruvate isomerase family mycothiol-dependent enzyme [Pseudonocardiaceae bacterium]
MLSHERYCSEIVTQTGLVRSCVEDADLTVPVPSCPGWNVGQLLRHLGGGQRWAEETVRTRATEPLPDEYFRDLSAYTDEDPAVVGPWLVEGAAQLADTLRAAGPGAQLWTPVPGGTAAFYARRFTHETIIHRADATLALGAEFTVDEQVAVDAVDEWMELGSLP